MERLGRIVEFSVSLKRGKLARTLANGQTALSDVPHQDPQQEQSKKPESDTRDEAWRGVAQLQQVNPLADGDGHQPSVDLPDPHRATVELSLPSTGVSFGDDEKARPLGSGVDCSRGPIDDVGC